MGFSVERKFYLCWRCGKHGIVETLEKLCKISLSEAIAIARAVKDSDTDIHRTNRDRESSARVNLSRYQRPGDVGTMRQNHRRYLEARGFDPDEIEREWGVLGTGPVSVLDGVNYSYRLFIPIVWDGTEVSFQARDVVGRSNKRYLACPADREIRSHKSILYGRQDRWGEVGIVVEGVTDAWRLGPKACATFGIKFTTEQVLAISRRFRRVAIVFDAEPQAQEQARLLAARLAMQEDPIVINLGGGVDPGSMSRDDASHLVRELL